MAKKRTDRRKMKRLERLEKMKMRGSVRGEEESEPKILTGSEIKQKIFGLITLWVIIGIYFYILWGY